MKPVRAISQRKPFSTRFVNSSAFVEICVSKRRTGRSGRLDAKPCRSHPLLLVSHRKTQGPPPPQILPRMLANMLHGNLEITGIAWKNHQDVVEFGNTLIHSHENSCP